MLHRGLRFIPLVLACFVVAGCSVPDSRPGAEEPVTLTTTVISGEGQSVENSPEWPTSTSKEPTSHEVDAAEFKEPNDYYGNELWGVVMRGGDLRCEVVKSARVWMQCAVKNWKNAPRTLMADSYFFGAADNRIGLDSSGGFEPQYIAPGLGGLSGDVELKPGETTTIEGYTFSVDNNDVVTVKSTGGWFTFDGSLTTQDWTQGVQANGWADPGNVCKRDKGPAGDDRVFFAGEKGANCEANLEAFAKYGEALKNPVPGGYGSGQIVQKNGWGCSASEFYAKGTSGADRKETCAVDGQGGIWVTDPTSYPADL
ncbi:hypothetical protein HMPREF1219_02234 [Corynebacterium pyruviciproducens ATCC BAA-1742]|uniref:Secreted protein n=1 Tax=Corynebacterium pyruviciproducens ATCC BAA-1742 TaxID=1125779 RepID=S2YU02_9CORY|nr:hypothetical protein [Corynebacterium pyruviciproducens]EPD67821.1 hypothetical protein HMPREF1219_02234 [Corynebacterium pyruviciproducens ATCC BAA-1742]